MWTSAECAGSASQSNALVVFPAHGDAPARLHFRVTARLYWDELLIQEHLGDPVGRAAAWAAGEVLLRKRRFLWDHVVGWEEAGVDAEGCSSSWTVVCLLHKDSREEVRLRVLSRSRPILPAAMSNSTAWPSPTFCIRELVRVIAL